MGASGAMLCLSHSARQYYGRYRHITHSFGYITDSKQGQAFGNGCGELLVQVCAQQEASMRFDVALAANNMTAITSAW